MINSPVLDTAIGLVFIFLLYSLLATSINELIATLFSMRARMLKKGIIEGMLSDSKHQKWLWQDTFKGIAEVIVEPVKLLIGYKTKPNGKLGDKLYNHPIIKNYGANSRYNSPAYISKENFSTVLIEVLTDYYDKHEEAIIHYIKATNSRASIDKLPTITKIFYLVEYLLRIDSKKLKDEFQKQNIDIDKETLEILQLHLQKSYLNLESFSKQIEDWYDDSMNRITGWYKRQVQLMLFMIGLSLAMLFNVNIIRVAGKLSTDKDARDKLVEMAIKNVDKLSNDARMAAKLPQEQQQASNHPDSIKQQIKDKEQEIQTMLKGDIADANNLLALGWGDYGFKENRSSFINDNKSHYYWLIKSLLKADSTKWALEKRKIVTKINNGQKPGKEEKETYNKIKKIYIDVEGRKNRAYKILFDEDKNKHKIAYVLTHLFVGNNILGFFLLAIGVSLGAPFWFDLLQKLIKIRGTGKKESTENEKAMIAPASQPIQVTLNNSTNTEAVG